MVVKRRGARSLQDRGHVPTAHGAEQPTQRRLLVRDGTGGRDGERGGGSCACILHDANGRQAHGQLGCAQQQRNVAVRQRAGVLLLCASTGGGEVLRRMAKEAVTVIRVIVIVGEADLKAEFYLLLCGNGGRGW